MTTTKSESIDETNVKKAPRKEFELLAPLMVGGEQRQKGEKVPLRKDQEERLRQRKIIA